MAQGGYRPGSGRKKGFRLEAKMYFKDYWSDDEKYEYMANLKKMYTTSPQLMQYVGDHIWGKAPQDLTLGGNVNQNVLIQFSILDHGRYQGDPSLPSPEAGRDLIPPGEVQGDGRGEEIWQNRRLA